MHLAPSEGLTASNQIKPPVRRPMFALVTLVPLTWLLTVTMTASAQKIFHKDPRIGFLSQAKQIEQKLPALQASVDAASRGGDAVGLETARKELTKQRTQRFNALLDAVVAGFFLVLVSGIVLLSVREWLLLLGRRRAPTLSEAQPVLLPENMLSEGKGANWLGIIPLAVALARELSGEAALDRAQNSAAIASTEVSKDTMDAKDDRETKHAVSARIDPELYVKVTEKRYRGVRRCC
jgi:carbon starvation protein